MNLLVQMANSQKANLQLQKVHIIHMNMQEIYQGPFPLGEPAIAKSTEYSKKYTQEVLKKDFYLDGKLICKYEGQVTNEFMEIL